MNGYIEEMISGQKVVKVFNHEDQAIADFRKLNDELRESAYQAHKFANILMPVTVQLGNKWTFCFNNWNPCSFLNIE